MEAFLDELSIEQVRKWRAYFEVVGSDAWRQAGTVAAEVGSLTAAITNAFGGKAKFPEPEDKMPIIRPGDSTGPNDGGIAALEKALVKATQ